MPKLPFSRKSTPRKQVTGTSLQSQGAVNPQQHVASLSELGSQAGGRIQEVVPILIGTQALLTYTRMVRGDTSVRTSLRAGKAPILGADFYVDPYDDSPDSDVIKDFVAHNLFSGMSSPFIKIIEQCLKMYENGYSVFEPVWEMREWTPPASATGAFARRKQYTMLKKIAVRPSSTITKINYDDNGGPLSIEQNAIRASGVPNKVTIPIEKLLIFTFDQDAGDLQGNSILRSAYPHWYYKDHLYKIDAVQKERHGIGVPDIELQPGFSPQDKAFAHQLGANLRTNESSYIVRTTTMKVGFAELKSQPVNALESAIHHDDMIMKNIMVQFLNMGLSGAGGRATGATAMDMFLKSMKYVAGSICDVFNSYLIPNLVAYNFKTDQFPKLDVRNIGETKDLQMWAAAMANLIKQKAIQVDDETEQWIRRQVDMPKRTTPFVQPTQAPAPNAQPTPAPNANGNTPPVPANGTGPTDTTGNVGKSPSSGAV